MLTKGLLVNQQISITWYILTVATSVTHERVRVIPGQIIILKQVNIYVYSIDFRYLPIANSLHARVYWPFKGSVALAFLFYVSIYYAILSIPCGLVAACWDGMAPRLWCCLLFLLLCHVVSRVQCDALLYQFLIFTFIFTLNNKLFV